MNWYFRINVYDDDGLCPSDVHIIQVREDEIVRFFSEFFDSYSNSRFDLVISCLGIQYLHLRTSRAGYSVIGLEYKDLNSSSRQDI